MTSHASIFRSSRGAGERLASRPGAPLAAADADLPHDLQVHIEPGHAFQEVMGFGAAFTEAAAFALSRAPAEAQERILHEHFAADRHNYRLCRVHMGSCDFALGNWSHVEREGDLALDSHSIDHDRRLLLPLVKRARAIAGDGLRIFASPWSPPGWMKTTGIMNRGGRLKAECRDAWAQCYVRFIRAYEAEGVPIWGVTVQNEPAASQPWDSCEYTAEEERDFIRDHLAPALDGAGLSHVQIIAWDHNRDVMVQRAAVYYADAAVRKRLWGVGFHWYCADVFDNVRLTHDAWPDKHLLFTEGCQEGGPHPGSWDVAERYATSMLNDLNRWTAGWVDWNLCLDSSGGPNHVGNLCSAPVLIDAHDGAVQWNPSFAAIGHLSRFIRPGARRLLCASQRDHVHAGAFANPDGSTAVVILNRGDGAHRLRIQLGRRCATMVEVPGHGMVTAVVPPA
ncbi:MAG: glycoside hydrolase family 30 protein [Planctomycetes bacterium]|nr:glycoside hydrolase family 30 protein [Planctomycetota bacterium]